MLTVDIEQILGLGGCWTVSTAATSGAGVVTATVLSSLSSWFSLSTLCYRIINNSQQQRYQYLFTLLRGVALAQTCAATYN